MAYRSRKVYRYLPLTATAAKLLTAYRQQIAYRLPSAICLPLTVGNLLTAYRKQIAYPRIS